MEIAYRRLLPKRLRRWLRSMVVECGIPTCRGFHLSHPVLRRLPGIFLDQTWYCSPECLREALKQRIEAQLGTAITDLRRPPRMPFRLILLAGGKVSAEQLEHARRVQQSGGSGSSGRSGGEDLGDALVRLGYSTDEEVAAARASEAGCLYFGGTPQPIPPAYAFPPSLIESCHAMPVHYSPVTGRLLIGFVYRIDNPLLQAVEQVTGCRVEACIIRTSVWRQHVAGLPPPAFDEVLASASRQARIVSLIVDHAIACHADKVRMGLGGTMLWARLAGGSRGRDLLIDLDAGRAALEEEREQTASRESRNPAPAAASRASRISSPVTRAGETGFPVFERRGVAP